MRSHIKLLGMILVASFCLPIPAFALKTHTYQCNECHRGGGNPRTLSNVCTPCHGPAARDNAPGAFTSAKASDAMGNHQDHAIIDYQTALPGDQTSHYWGGAKTDQLAAGSTNPATTFYNSSYLISTNKITCSICHDPHAQAGTQLLRVSKVDDLICQQCHTGFYQDNADALMTHPIGDKTNPLKSYAAIQAANPSKFKVVTPDALGKLDTNTGSGEIKLVNGYISCTSCHAPHFADSDSSTSDGKNNIGLLHKGDSHILKANGPFAANNSLLCQTCHTYKRHGNPASNSKQPGRTALPQEDVGCLDCHSGHSYNGGVPNYFVLRNIVKTDTFGEKTNALYTPLTDAFLMNKQNGTGFCERCHGLSSAIPFHSLANGGSEDRYLQNCKDCHKHNEAGFDFSWKWSGNSNLCGDCHGFPPYLNVEGDYKDTGADVGTKGGFAVMDNGGSDDGHSYATSGYSKSELLTPHKSHAGGGEALGAYIEVTDYKFAEGQGACTATCHDLNSHKQVGVTASFRDIVWGPIAKGNIAPNAVNLSPVYTTTGNGSCGTVYCHSNGGARPAGAVDRAKISTDFKFAPAAPAWGTGDADIIGVTAPNHECAYFCHGNSAATMATGTPAQLTYRNNSVSHIKHLNKGYTCNVCHKLTAGVGSNTVVLNTARLAPNGTHVNGKPDVSFDTTNDFDPGQAGTQLNIIKPASGDAGSGYNAVTGVCNVYCHSDGKAVLRTYANVDWDQASTAACGTCHQYYSGGVPTGSGAALSATHGKHFAIAVALTCDDCHGTNASAGTHTGHVNTLLTTVAGSCNACHGIDGVEAVPQWNAPMSNDYCISCHTGSSFGNIKGAMTAPNKQHATDRGHNRTTNYPSGNLPGNKLCTSCHLTSITNHVNLTDGDATHLAAAATTCTATCHGPGGSAVGANTKGIVSHFDRACKNCHDPHGDTTLATNIYMIRSVSTGTGNYSGAVDFRVKTGSNSYDEVDAANADDLCATCHTYGTHPLSTHNTKTNQGIAHHEGENCMTAGCHKGHTEPTGAFVSGGGTQCNDCHGNPPLSNAQLKTYGLQYGAHAAHTFVGNPLPGEDRTDCEICHPGAATYSLSHSNGGGAVNLDPRIVAGSLGGGNYSCATFNSDLGCHASSATDGYWTDIDDAPYVGNGLNCTACHNASGSNDGVLANAAPNSGAHAKHKVANKTCTDCHNNGVAITDTTHINSFGYAGAADDSAAIVDKATATLGEGTVLRNLTTYDQVTNFTCSGGIGLACHNSKVTPNWRTFTNITCTNCHNPTTSDAADPKTGLHNIGVTEAAAGVQKHDSTLPGGGCTACHNSTKPATHADGTFNNDTAVRTDRFLTVKAGMFVDNATANRGTCSGTGNLTGCHSDSGNWTRLWSTEANSTAKNSGSARCNVCHGQYSTLSGSGGRGWNAGTSHYNTAGGATSSRGETHHSVAGENNACEDCHSYTTLGGGQVVPANHDTATHFLNVNNDAADIIVTESVEGWVYCAKCHTTGNPATAGTKTFPKSIFTRQLMAGSNDPKQECNSCHGVGGSGRYWPVAAYGTGDPENDRGRHEIHMGRLAQARFYTAAATPMDAVTQLLADVNTKNNQIELCKYCHPGLPGQDTGHNNTVTNVSSAPTNYMHALWTDTTVNDTNATYTGTGANNTGTCANVNCHNEKNTSSIASFTWYSTNELVVGTGTQNCLLCHNDVTAASGTGVTHSAHLATKFGKVITCGSCHGGSPTWSPYAVAAATAGNRHIDGAFKVGTASNAPITFSYTGVYTNQATRTLGTCATNLCHNNGAGGTPYNSGLGAYNWQTAMTDCTACHRNDSNLGSSHTPHLTAAVATFGKTPICVDCHEAVSATDMTGKANHINGAVTIASLSPMSAMTYSGAGTLDVVIGGGNTYGACTGSCHSNGKAGGSPAVTATWNSAQAANCTICHLAPNTAGNDGARHSKHYNAHNNYVAAAKCGECHLGATLTTYNSTNHFSGTVQTGNKILTHTAGAADCTNSCHVVSAARGDWLDTDVLACADCHVAGKIAATAGAMPTSGLHNITPRISTKKHDATLHANGCEVCHTTIRTSPNHIKGTFPADTTSNTDRGLFSPTYSDASGSCSGAAVGGSCHQDNGKWGRKWSTTAQNNDGSECSNCHGKWTTWTTGVVPDHTANWDGTEGAEVQANHGECKTCHGFNSDADKDANYVAKHRDGNITMNLTTNYIEGNWGCDNAQCHGGGGAGLHGMGDSGWTVQRVSFTTTGGVCDSCHGYPPLPPGYVKGVGNYEKGKVEDYPGAGGGHAIVKHLAKNILPADAWTPCAPCHYDNATNHNMGGNVTDRAQIQVEIDPVRDYKVPALYQKGLPDNVDGMGQCKNLNCHFTESPKWDCSP